MAKFSFVARIAFGSISVAIAWCAPNFNPIIERIPLPVPTSRSSVSFLIYFLSWEMQSFVVSWDPLPNAVPGSISITISSSFLSERVSQVGLITILSSKRNGLKNTFQLLIQSSSSVTPKVISPLPIGKNADNSSIFAFILAITACKSSFSST